MEVNVPSNSQFLNLFFDQCITKYIVRSIFTRLKLVSDIKTDRTVENKESSDGQCG